MITNGSQVGHNVGFGAVVLVHLESVEDLATVLQSPIQVWCWLFSLQLNLELMQNIHSSVLFFVTNAAANLSQSSINHNDHFLDACASCTVDFL